LVAVDPGSSEQAFFYAESCHPVSRRQVLIGAGTLLALGAVGRRFAGAGDDGAAIIRQWATRPDDPWVVCHGVRAMGRDFSLKGGKRAVDWLLETHLASLPANGSNVLAFPLAVEVHPNMFVKTLLEAGVPLDYAFTHEGRRRTVNEVVEGARALFRPSEVITQPNMLPWSLITFARTTSPLRGRWTNAWGEPVDLEIVFDRALRLMEEASMPLMQAMREGRRETVKAPVHGFTCGGAHMLYGLLTGVWAGYGGQDRAERVQRQLDLMLWRLSADQGLIERFYRERATQPGSYWYELDAKLKLLGHGEECIAFATHRGVAKLTAAQLQQRSAAVTTLGRIIEDMEGRNLGEPLRLDQYLFAQLVGDTCHARHGLTLT
jgi:hypothetical protein